MCKKKNQTATRSLSRKSQASFIVLCWMQVCSTSLAQLWTSARTQRCISSTSRPHARRAKSKRWSGSVGKATATTLNVSRTFSRYCQDFVSKARLIMIHCRPQKTHYIL